MARFTIFIYLLIAQLLGMALREEGGGLVIETDARAVAAGNNRFAVDLFRTLRSRPGNVSFAPASLSGALALTSEGARGETAAEIARVFHFPDDRPTIRAGFHALNARLNGDGRDRPYTLASANSLWGQQGDPFRPDYLSLARETYGAEVTPVDFRRDPGSARLSINAWVDGRTNHLIPELLGRGAVDKTTSLVLVNSLYFKGTWQSPFVKAATSPADFHLAPGRTTRAPLMRQSGQFSIAQDDAVQVLQMPYKGGDLAMVVVLPRSADGLGAVEQALTPAGLDGWLAALKPERVAVELPRWKLSTALDLGDTLASMGMPSAFGSSADFSGIDGTRALSISKVVHQAVVDVNEEGTEAAAATGVAMARTSAMRPTTPVTFKADHPFLYLIRDVQTGAILFLGRVADPTH